MTQAKTGTYGAFQGSNIDWDLTTGQGPGLVVQEVTRTFDVRNSSNVKLSADEIKKLTGNDDADVASTHYSECWPVGKDWQGPKTADSFNFSGVAPGINQTGCKGSFKQVGVAYFVQTTDAKAGTISNLGFNKKLAIANGLPSVTGGMPSGVTSLSVKSNTITHTVEVSWDESGTTTLVKDGLS